jgi:hypothetical protein
MRLVNVVFAAAVMMFVIAGVASLVGTAVAQEQSTRQTLQTREVTRQEPVPENTAQAPEQSDDQANTACPGAVLIDSVGPTDKDLVTTRPFTITGESLRLTYETTDADESGLPFVDVTVLDQAGKEVGGQVIFDEGVVREIVRSGPGKFDFEITAEDLKYKLTIEDCTGNGNQPPDSQNVPTTPIPEDQYRRDVDPPNEDDVIDDTISDTPLPNTGGVPLLGLAVFGSIFTFGAFAVLGPVVRRDSRR